MEANNSQGAQVPLHEVKPYDIKCGQDKMYEQQLGNRLLRTKIQESIPRYHDIFQMTSASGKKKLKTTQIKHIVAHMKRQYGTRFLRLDRTKKYWVELCEKLAHEKVSHALRTYLKRYIQDSNNDDNSGDISVQQHCTQSNSTSITQMPVSYTTLVNETSDSDLDFDNKDTAMSCLVSFNDNCSVIDHFFNRCDDDSHSVLTSVTNHCDDKVNNDVDADNQRSILSNNSNLGILSSPPLSPVARYVELHPELHIQGSDSFEVIISDDDDFDDSATFYSIDQIDQIFEEKQKLFQHYLLP
jgi:hypothetical protein